MSQQNTSTSVGFSDKGKRLILESDSSPSLLERPGKSYARVFPSSANPEVTAVTGRAARIGSRIPEKVTDYVTFTDSDSSSLRYPPTGTVVIEKSRFHRDEPAVAYDVESNSIVLSNAASGVVRISYTAHFDRYVVTHNELVSHSNSGASAVRTFEPAFLVAEADEYEIATTEMSAPSPVDDSVVFIEPKNGNYERLGLVMETDVEYPPAAHPEYFSADKTFGGFTLQPQVWADENGKRITAYVGCKVRVYPRGSVTLVGVNCAVSSSPVGRGTRPILEALNFSGSQSVNLSYPPSSKVSLSATQAQALTKFGTQVAVSFAGPEDWVNEVEWSGPSTYKTLASSRRVRDDEVVTTTTVGRRTVPCYTFCEARYTSDFQLYDVLFNFDPATNWYGSAMVLAYDSDGSMVSMTIEPPTRSGIL